jgi:hypothetical protein
MGERGLDALGIQTNLGALRSLEEIRVSCACRDEDLSGVLKRWKGQRKVAS